MNSYGKEETEVLKKNLKNQLQRLVKQLEDLDECKNELDSSEYEETKKDTMDQMNELNESLQRILSGDMTLVDNLGAIQLATQAAISESCTTPAIIKMFSGRKSEKLREKFKLIQNDIQCEMIDKKTGEKQLREILYALKYLNEKFPSNHKEDTNISSDCGANMINLVEVSHPNEKNYEALAIAMHDVEVNYDL